MKILYVLLIVIIASVSVTQASDSLAHNFFCSSQEILMDPVAWCFIVFLFLCCVLSWYKDINVFCIFATLLFIIFLIIFLIFIGEAIFGEEWCNADIRGEVLEDYDVMQAEAPKSETPVVKSSTSESDLKPETPVVKSSTSESDLKPEKPVVKSSTSESDLKPETPVVKSSTSESDLKPETPVVKSSTSESDLKPETPVVKSSTSESEKSSLLPTFQKIIEERVQNTSKLE